ncbi:hypothetical protein [Sporomusa acidovorans]|uniref:Uncharacterized protein n=1 Tax=Sporomusa acidovorans (strain ATCC 49682 / DSM 3132 / Mol) TaxID=1123286 RepID=A0ABZ3JBD0_SPOA4|nr:hypothetical protein [Sporomusa acidovorans]OZC21626.1 hypothetical protein SPACI_16990 [Sporomusa acidovorans DSM 3132]SDD62168.1 hypothetical protein SAMN04488499_1002242 [Sporomusa acidovorans]
MENQDESQTHADLDNLEKHDVALNNLDEKERLSVAMSSYYILYR